MPDLTGKTLDNNRYHVLARLGEGGMGTVYRARDAVRGCQVAIKVLRPMGRDHARQMERFRREGESLVRSGHPHIVRFYGWGSDGDLTFFVMDHVDGPSLERRLAERQGQPLPLSEALDIVYQIGGALHYAHQHGILHRDIKPANILFDRADKAYLADFGLARLADLSTLTTHEPVLGTWDYGAPEQLMGEAVDARTDVYALGLVLYEMLVGRPPFEGDPTTRIAEPPPPPRQWNPSIPPEVEGVLLRALDSSKDYRPFDVANFLCELQMAEGKDPLPLADLPERPLVAPEPDAEDARVKGRGPALRQKRPFRTLFLPWLLGLAMGMALLAIAGGAFLPRWGVLATTAATASPMPSVEPTATAAQPSPTAALASLPNASPPPTATPTPSATPAPTSTLVPTPTPTTTASPTPCCTVSTSRLAVHAGPGTDYDLRGEVLRGDQLLPVGRSQDGTWLVVDYLGRQGWVTTHSVEVNIDPLALPAIDAPPTLPPSTSAQATKSLPSHDTPFPLQNGTFGNIGEDVVPGWGWWAEEAEGFAKPALKQADDPDREIHGPTLQVDAAGFLKFKVHIFQTVQVGSAVPVRFQVMAGAYTDVGTITVAAGLDPNGGYGCSRAAWGQQASIDETHDPVLLTAPVATAGLDGRVTVCLYAETPFAAKSNAAFFDDAELILKPR